MSELEKKREQLWRKVEMALKIREGLRDASLMIYTYVMSGMDNDALLPRDWDGGDPRGLEKQLHASLQELINAVDARYKELREELAATYASEDVDE